MGPSCPKSEYFWFAFVEIYELKLLDLRVFVKRINRSDSGKDSVSFKRLTTSDMNPCSDLGLQTIGLGEFFLPYWLSIFLYIFS